MEKKLIEVAKEFNVGKDNIVEFLHSKGFDIDNRPIARLSDDMFAAVSKQFQDSRADKKKADTFEIGIRPGSGTTPPAPVAPAKKETTTPTAVSPTPVERPVLAPKTDKSNDTKPTPKDENTGGGAKIALKPITGGREKIEKTTPPPAPPAKKEIADVIAPVEKKAEPVKEIKEKVEKIADKPEKVVDSAPVVTKEDAPKSLDVDAKVSILRHTPKVLGKIDLDQVRKNEELDKSSRRKNEREFARDFAKERQKVKQQKQETKDANNSTNTNTGNNNNSNNNTGNGNRNENSNNNNRSEVPANRGDNRGNNSNNANNNNNRGENNRNRGDNRNDNRGENNRNRDRDRKTLVLPNVPIPPPLEDGHSLTSYVAPETIRAEAPTLGGLKIQGKIDLVQFEKPKPRRSEGGGPNAPLKEGEVDPRKRKRKRKKIGSDSPNPTGQNTTGGGGQQGGNRTGGQNTGGGGQQGGNRTGGQNTGGGGQQGGIRPAGQNTGGGGQQGGYRGGQNTGGGGQQGGYRGGQNTGGGGFNRGGQGGGFRPNTPTTPSTPGEISKREIEEKLKATMNRLGMGGGGGRSRQKVRRDKRDKMREKEENRQAELDNAKLQLTEFITVAELASLLNVSVAEVISSCMSLGYFVSINQRLDAEVIGIVAEEFGQEVEFISADAQNEEDVAEEVDAPEDLVWRAPIITVMGHVDHGKTSLLDHIRKANVVSGEAGGITQHIGAYEVIMADERKITFLDTPGHEAFTAMRARGAKVTDVAVIIIAADDSIMPQTREAISHAQAAGVPIIFAINKIDKDGASPDRIKQELSGMDLLVEEWGGKYQSQDIAAKKGLNVDLLLEKILLEAEILDLKANPNKRAVGTVIEASLDKGRGYVTKILVQSGTLKIGDPIIAGEHAGKVRAMFNERGQKVLKAGPSTPVLVLGLGGAPQAGEKFRAAESESEAKQVANKRAQIVREQSLRATKRISLDEIGRRLALGNFKELNVIVKGDVDGSVEALSDALIKQSHETVAVRVIHKAVGAISDSDILLASASDAIVVGFQVRPSPSARKLAEREGVEIKHYSIIYEAISEIRSAIEGMLEPTKEEKITGQVEIREVYKTAKYGIIAGCYVQEGSISRNSHIRVIRDGIVVFPMKEGAIGGLGSLKRFKDDVKEVKRGFECGLTIDNYQDFQMNDIIEVYEIIEVKQKLK